MLARRPIPPRALAAPTTSRMADHWLKTAGSNALSRQVREPQGIKIGAFFT